MRLSFPHPLIVSSGHVESTVEFLIFEFSVSVKNFCGERGNAQVLYVPVLIIQLVVSITSIIVHLQTVVFYERDNRRALESADNTEQ